MFIAIKNQEMPKCCDECFALDDHWDYPYCMITQTSRGYDFNTQEKRIPDCPLVPLPNTDLVSMTDVIWALADYFIPRQNINHVVSQDINLALKNVPIVVTKEVK